MDYSLTVHQRLLLLDLLPAQGDLLTIRIVHDLREALSFDETEHLLLNFREEGSGFAWDDKVPPKPIDIGPKAADIIRQAIAERDRQRKLHEEHLILVDLFEYEGA